MISLKKIFGTCKNFRICHYSVLDNVPNLHVGAKCHKVSNRRQITFVITLNGFCQLSVNLHPTVLNGQYQTGWNTD